MTKLTVGGKKKKKGVLGHLVDLLPEKQCSLLYCCSDLHPG